VTSPSVGARFFGSVTRVDGRLTQRRVVDLCRVDSSLCC
jgi:hypothetical protein